jgi:SAM-dependent methyltransferase
MLGEKIDTFILRLIAHDRNILTEEQIEAKTNYQAETCSYVAIDKDFVKFTSRAGKYFDWKGKKILDVACGKGNLANFLAKKGASAVWGIDIQNKHLRIARSVAKREDINNVIFIEGDFHKWETQERFDYVISYEALDHIPNTRATLEKMANLLRKEGKIINFAAGFWFGPSADHCDEFMRFFIPWRHLLFNEKALFNVRREKYRPTDPATCFEDIRGGLSKYTLSGYKKAIFDSGLKICAFETNYQFKYKYKGLLYPISNFFTRIPLIGELFVFSTFAVLTKRSS